MSAIRSSGRLSSAPRLDGKRLDPERLSRLGRVSAAVPSPCGTWLAVAVSRLDDRERVYVSDLWRVSLSDPGQPPARLTCTDSRDASPRFRHDGALYFLSDRAVDSGRSSRSSSGASPGGERFQVWQIPAAGGEPRPVTDAPLGVSDFRLASKTGHLFVITDVFLGIPHERQRAHHDDLKDNGPSGRHYTSLPVRQWDHWVPPAAPHILSCGVEWQDSSEWVDLTPDADRELRPIDFSVGWDVDAEGRRVAVAMTSWTAASRLPEGCIRVIEVTRGQYSDLGDRRDTTHEQPTFSPDGRAVACIRSRRHEGKATQNTLWLFDVSALEPENPPDAGQPDTRRSGSDHPAGRALAEDWDVWPTLEDWTPDGAALIATAGHLGHVPVFRVAVASGEVERLTSKDAAGSHQGISVTGDGAHLVGLRHRLHHPPEPFRVALRSPSGDGAEPELLACLSGFPAEHGASIADIEWIYSDSDDGTAIHSMVMAPVHAEGPFPTFLWIHGGPTGQYSDGWHWRWNPLVPASYGYAVVQPNPRGSTGYGQKFIDEIYNNEWGGACYDDIMAVTDAISARDDIDGERIAAMGGSFGGYMANWIGGNTDRFRCLMTHAGVYSLSSFTGSTDYPPFMEHMFGVSHHEDLDTFERHSANRLVTKWKTPTLIIHGERDYRVPIGQALELFDALSWKGVPVELLVFPDENHWIARPQNVRQWYRTVLEFAARYLLP